MESSGSQVRTRRCNLHEIFLRKGGNSLEGTGSQWLEPDSRVNVSCTFICTLPGRTPERRKDLATGAMRIPGRAGNATSPNALALISGSRAKDRRTPNAPRKGTVRRDLALARESSLAWLACTALLLERWDTLQFLTDLWLRGSLVAQSRPLWVCSLAPALPQSQISRQ